MTLPETADAINQDAADWAARADRGLTDNEAAELTRWLAADPRRLGAYTRMSAVLAAIELKTGLDDASGPRRQLALGGTRRWWLGAAAAASVAGVGVYLGLGRPEAYETAKGEMRIVTLKDGSTATLNTSTRLEVRYAQDRRIVRLVGGEALFDVAHNAARPFVVQAEGVDVRAIGTSFTVTAPADRTLRVVVREGVVEVRRPHIPAQTPVRLEANSRAIIGDADASVVVSRISPAEVTRELAWRDGQLFFAGESLAAAAAEFARYSDTRIVISDPVLANSGVAGVFDAKDPVGFARAVAGSLESRVELREGKVLITR